MSNWFLVGVTLVLAVLTGYYAWRTHRLSDAADKQVRVPKDTIERSIHPYIYFGYKFFQNQSQGGLFRPNEIPGRMDFYVKNGGKGPAINILIEFLSSEEYEFKSKNTIPFTDHYDEITISFLDKEYIEDIVVTLNPPEISEIQEAKYLLFIARYSDELGQLWETKQYVRFIIDHWEIKEISQYRLESDKPN